jgi:hypothetical protein
MATICHFIGCLGDGCGDVCADRAHLRIHSRGGTFDHRQSDNEGGLDRLAGYGEVLDGSLRLCRPTSALGHPDFTH